MPASRKLIDQASARHQALMTEGENQRKIEPAKKGQNAKVDAYVDEISLLDLAKWEDAINHKVGNLKEIMKDCNPKSNHRKSSSLQAERHLPILIQGYLRNEKVQKVLFQEIRKGNLMAKSGRKFGDVDQESPKRNAWEDEFDDRCAEVWNWPVPNDPTLTNAEERFEAEVIISPYTPADIFVKVIGSDLVMRFVKDSTLDADHAVQRTFQLPINVDSHSVEFYLSEEGRVLRIQALKIPPIKFILDTYDPQMLKTVIMNLQIETKTDDGL